MRHLARLPSSGVAVPSNFRESARDTTSSRRSHRHRRRHDRHRPADGPVGPRAGGRHGGSGVILARAGRHDARPADGRAGARQSRRAGRRGPGARRRAARRSARSTWPRRSRSAAATPASDSRARPFRSGRQLPGPGSLGRRIRRVVGAGPVRTGAAGRAGAGRAGGRRRRGSEGRAGGAHGRAGAHLLRAARRAGAARGGPPQRGEPAPDARGDPAAARRRPGHRLRHRAGPHPARLHPRLDPALEAQVASAQFQVGVLVGRPPAGLADELGATAAIPTLPADVGVNSRLADPPPPRCRLRRAAGGGRARLRRLGQGGVPAADHGRRERRILRRGR